MKVKRHHKDGKLDFMELLHTGVSVEQNFSSRLVTRAQEEGWMSLSGKKLVVKTREEDLLYEVLRTPGYYCLHCGEKITSDSLGEGARAHVSEKHHGATSPDNAWPAGYLVTNAYECRLDAGQHERHRAYPIGQKGA